MLQIVRPPQNLYNGRAICKCLARCVFRPASAMDRSAPAFHLPLGNLHLEPVSGGCMNRLHKASFPDAKDPENREPFLIKIYADEKNGLFDRRYERSLMEFLSANGLFGKFYGAEKNAVFYEFQHGRSLSTEDLRDPKISRLVAKSVATWHATCRTFPGRTSPFSVATCHEVFRRWPIKYLDPKVLHVIGELFPPMCVMQKEFDSLLAHPSMRDIYRGQDQLFCHHDLFATNLLYDEDAGRVRIIDFEFAGVGYPADDIGYHFTQSEDSSAAVLSADNQAFELNWISTYLDTARKLLDDRRIVSEEDVWNMYVSAKKSSLVRRWQVIMFLFLLEEDNPNFRRRVETIDWNSLEHAKKCLDAYHRKKEAILSLEFR